MSAPNVEGCQVVQAGQRYLGVAPCRSEAVLYHRSMAPTSFLGAGEEQPLDRRHDCSYNSLRSVLAWMGRYLDNPARSHVKAMLKPEVVCMEETYDACIALGQQCGFEEEHSRQDAWIAVRLFD